MNLVIGATGYLGGEICRQLVAANKPVRALVRTTSDREKRAGLQALGVELVEGDLKDAASLAAACEGVAAVISTASATISRQPGDSLQSVDRDGQINLIDAARAAGAANFIYVSAHLNVDCPLTAAKHAVEQHLRESGLTYTILQPTNFMEVWLSPLVGFDATNARAQVFGTGQNPVSWISLRDVAQFAVAALDHPTARNAVIPLGGPAALSPLEVVAIFEQLTGRSFTVQHIPIEALQAQVANATDPLDKTMAALTLATAQGDAIAMESVLRVFPVRLTSVADFARAVITA